MKGGIRQRRGPRRSDMQRIEGVREPREAGKAQVSWAGAVNQAIKNRRHLVTPAGISLSACRVSILARHEAR